MLSLGNKNFLAFFCIFVFGCQSTKKFQIKTFHIENQELHTLNVASNRIKQECLFLDAEAENKWRHQYLMFALSDNDQVFEIAHSINMDKDSCQEQITKIEKILKSEPYAKLCVRDNLKKKDSTSGSWEEKVDFSSLGTHPVSYDSLTFDTICNSKKCYGDNSAWTYTCPGFVKQ
ncbi:MAG: hypothetical protein B7Y39_17505 [Bdellovibrio sp. 28-41-41]|nr:MAG: hypothetical protein B7Y39_17505 [Bdellovibrio sp. 28-41-41]